VKKGAPKSTRDLRPSERCFLTAMQQLSHGWFESLRILRGELVLDPWPTTVQEVRFGGGDESFQTPPDEFNLKRHFVEFFEYVRSADVGEIRRLVVRRGLPASMEIERRFRTSTD
jgi:hypothetical protein